MKTKQSLGVLGALGAASLMLAACGGGGGGTTPTTDPTTEGGEAQGPAGGDHSFIYLTNDPIGVNKFLESGKIGIEKAAEKFNGTSKTFEGSTEESLRENLEAAVAEAPDVIVMITFDFTDLSKEFAEANPDQEFLLIDDCPQDAPANLTCAVFREYEASYLIGVQAGMLTEVNKVGSVMALDIPFLHRYSDAFFLGAQSVNPDVTDTQLAIGGENPFGDPAKGKEQALAMADTGADHVFAVGAGSNGGIFEAAAERGFTAYGVDVNQCPDAPGAIGDGTLKAVDVLVVSEIGKILAGTNDPIASYGLAEGGMDIVSLTDGAADSQCTVMEHPEVVAKLAEVKNDIVSGKLTIDDPMMAG